MTTGKNKTLTYDPENRLISVNYGLITESYLYDGDGGRVRKTTDDGRGTRDATTYIGSLYEVDSNGVIRKHIYAGANRVCTVTKDEARQTTDASYYHSDHLGSSSVITDAGGNQVESYEYTPYGSVASSVVSRPSSLIRHKFTGKELDSSGLYFYGARYYDPEIGRFITADTIVQAPYDPQSLNRYSYVRNNPINYIDPTGHDFWKKLWGGIKDFVRDYGGLFGMTGGLLNGIINNDWQPLKNMAIAGATAFVSSGFNPVAGLSAIATTGFLDSKPGRQVTGFVSSEIMDDTFGMRPGSAYVWARLTLQIAGTLAVENMLKSAMADPATASKYDPKNPAHKAITDNPKGYSPSGGRIPGGENAPEYAGKGFNLNKPDVNMLALTVKGEPSPTAVLGTGKFGSGMLLHTGVASSSFPGAGIENLALGNNFLNGYATAFGVCHQAANATLLASGMSSTVWDLAPHWSTIASTLTYGNYGGQLMNYIYTGIRTERGYEN